VPVRYRWDSALAVRRVGSLRTRQRAIGIPTAPFDDIRRLDQIPGGYAT
jgi:hypothetical protein